MIFRQKKTPKAAIVIHWYIITFFFLFISDQGVSQLFSFVGIVASSLGILGLMTTSRLYQPQIGRSGTLQADIIL